MKHSRWTWIWGGSAVAGGLVWAWVLAGGAGLSWAKDANPPAKLNIQNNPLARETKAATSFAPVIKKVSPSVVNIYTTKRIRENPRMQNPLFDDPFFRFFGGDMFDRRDQRPRTRLENSLGSGVIVTQDGYVLSNNHVVEGADEIKVALANGDQSEFTARIIGTDPQTDIAVLKIDEGRKFPAITMTDSDQLEVGDTVLAIGNPFGVGQTVTMGIVSATGRSGFGIVDYEDFIQTDASINPGNSGGALVDAEGRLVGINTAIISRTGGSQGIGFAVPINMARGVMERIVAGGKVTRGFLGVTIQPVTADLAKEFKLSSQAGALVGGVMPKTPAAEAGFKEGDVILEFNGKKVTDSRQLRLLIAQTAPETKSRFKILRDGKELTLTATLGQLPGDKTSTPGGPRFGRGQPKEDVLDGVTVGDLDARTRRQFGLPAEARGALVTEVDPGSPAYAAGLRAGDIILEINRRPVQSADEAVELSERIEAGRVLLRVWSNGGSRYLVVENRARR
jgi:serine protease Do